jgi:hypothetical protein
MSTGRSESIKNAMKVNKMTSGTLQGISKRKKTHFFRKQVNEKIVVTYSQWKKKGVYK